jgi:multifunctional methyltransferase subunit TRM112
MRLLTHNLLRNNAAASSKSTSPPRITAATKIRVDETTSSTSSCNDEDEDENDNAYVGRRREVEFAKHILPILDWDELLHAAKALGLHSLPPMVTPELAADDGFLRALYHVVMNVHLVDGILTCSITGREFPVSDGIVNMMLEEEEC